MKTILNTIIDGKNEGMEVRKAMKWMEVRWDGKAGQKSDHRNGSSFMATLALLTMCMLALMLAMPDNGYSIASLCQFSETNGATTPYKTGEEEQMFRFATTTGSQDRVTKITMNLLGVASEDVAYVKIYHNGTNVAQVLNPTSVMGLAFVMDVKPGNIASCPGTASIAAGVWQINLGLNLSGAGKGTAVELLDVAGSNNAGLPYDTAPRTFAEGCKARPISNTGLLGKLYNSISITWTPDSNNTNYRIYRQREDETGITQIATGVIGSQYQDQTDAVADCPPNHSGADAPGGALCELSKYAYIVNGYEVGNACESEEGNTLISMTRSSNKFNITTCGGCHTTPPDDALSQRGTPDGAVIGRHANPYHTGGVSAGDEACVKCHVNQTSPSHRDKFIIMNSTNIFGFPGSYYDKNRINGYEAGIDNHFAMNNNPINLSDLSDNGVCVATWCHGTRAASPVWGSSSGKKQCNLCHGMGQGAIAWDAEMQNSPFDEQVGAHDNHLHASGTAFLNISTANSCTECHVVPVKHTDAGHYTDAEPAEIVFGTIATNGGAVTPVYSTAANSCSNTYCHDGRNFKNKWSSGAQVAMPVWNNANFLNNGGDSVNCTNKCHGNPPDNAAHEQTDLNCRGCHTHVGQDNMSFNQKFYKHIDGVVTGLLCSGCHGQPPINNTTSIINANSPFGTSKRYVEIPQAQGAHAKHNGTTLGIASAADVCMVCHWGGGSTGEHLQLVAPDYVSIGFNTAGGGKKGWYQAPNYTSNPNYILNSSDSGTFVNNGVGAKRVCSSIYCHSNGSDYAGTYTYRFADWDTGSLGGCQTTCHGNGSLFVATNAHIKHINGVTYGTKCQTCHNATVAANNSVIGNHVNGAKNVIWNSDPRLSGASAYNKAGTDCQNIYCHSDGRGTYAGTEWNAAGSCTLCHGGLNTTTGGAGTRLSSAHAVHANTTTMNYGCTDCHNDVAIGNTTIKSTGYALHANQTKNIAFNATRDAGTGGSYTGGSCSDINCHGAASPGWTASVHGNQCVQCHGEPGVASPSEAQMAPGGSGWDTGGNTLPGDAQVGAHQAHLTSQSNYTADVACSNCHLKPAVVTTAGHLDSALPAEMSWAGNAVLTGVNPNYTTGTCSGTYCHGGNMLKGSPPATGTDRQPTWANTAYLTGTPNLTGDCNKCHSGTPVAAGLDHTGKTIGECSGCHSHLNGSGGFTNPALHIDGVVQALSCTGCHGQPPTNTATIVNQASTLGGTVRNSQFSNAAGRHIQHSTRGYGCASCHTGGQPTGGQHSNTVSPTIVSMGFNASGTLQGWYQAPSYSANANYVTKSSQAQTTVVTAAGGRVCSSVYCHSDGRNYAGTITFKFANWDDATTPLPCNTCHGGSGQFVNNDAHVKHVNGITYNVKCQMCHSATVNVSNAIINAAWHVNNVKNIVWSGSDSRVSSATAYNKAGADCTNVYCHSDGKGVYKASGIEWSAAATNCTSCHGGTNGSAGGALTPLSAAHTPHTNATNGYGCVDCHERVAQNNTSIKSAGFINHVNNVRNVNVAAARDIGTPGNYTAGRCSNMNCHGTRSPVWNAAAPTGNKCVRCHGQSGVASPSEAQIAPGGAGVDTKGQSVATDATVGAHQAHLTSESNYTADVACNNCHVKPTTINQAVHIDNALPAELTFNNNAILCGVSPTYVSSTCSGTYCHGGNMLKGSPPANGTDKRPTWANTAYLTGTPDITGDCNKCHSGTPIAAGLDHTGKTLGECSSCHSHLNGSGGFTNPALHMDGVVQALSCTGCHGQPPINNSTIINAGATLGNSIRYTQFPNAPGKHSQHSAKGYGCSTCHTGGQPAGGEHTQGTRPDYVSIGFNTIGVMQGFYQAPDYTGNTSYDVNASAAGTTVNYPIAGSRVCTNIICHSDGKTSKAYVRANWDDNTVWSGNCNKCHGGVNGTLGNSASALSGRHIMHANTTTFSYKCVECHTSTVNASNSIINTAWHPNNAINTVLNGVSGTYDSGPTQSCSNTKCHGTASSGWSVNMGFRDSCTVCHGTPTTGANGASLATVSNKIYAPGNGGTGKDTGGNTLPGDAQVGAHQAHLDGTTGYAAAVKCGNCHIVPASVTASGHNDTLLPAEITWAGNAVLTGVNPNYTTGTCSATFCHGGNMPKMSPPVAGTDRRPTWVNTAYLTGTPSVTGDCNKCHAGNPNAPGESHTGYAIATCNGCHDHVNANGTFNKPELHIDGVIQGGGDCISCHGKRTLVGTDQRAQIVGNTAGLEGDDFIRRSRHVSNGAAISIVTKWDCVICHFEGNIDGSTNAKHKDKIIDLRNVDTYTANVVAWPGWRLKSFTATSAQRDGMDTFCMNCHDWNGASDIVVNNTNDGILTAPGTTKRTAIGNNANSGIVNAALRPFNTQDNLNNVWDSQQLRTFRMAGYGRVLDVKKQFNKNGVAGSNWASHHNLRQFTKRYTSRNSVAWPNAAWTTYTPKSGGGTLQAQGETAGLHCSDCHLNESNAHGTRNSWYMLSGKTSTSDVDVAPGLGTVLTTDEISCYKCHASASYGDGGTVGARATHGDCQGRVDLLESGPMKLGCSACHGGFSETNLVNGAGVIVVGGLGAIHGNNDIYKPNLGTLNSKRYRFMSGATMRFYNPNSAAATFSADTNWALTSNSGQCYTVSTGDMWATGCTSHKASPGEPSTGTTRGRALSY